MQIQAAEIEIHDTEMETTTTHIVFPLQKTFIHVFFLPSSKFNQGRPYRRYKVSLYTPRYLKFDIHTLRNLRSQRIGPTTSPLRNPRSIPGIPGLCGDRQADNLPRFKLSVLTGKIGPHGSTLQEKTYTNWDPAKQGEIHGTTLKAPSKQAHLEDHFSW